MSQKKSAWLGAGIGFGFQTTLEILDGGNGDWGFSWCDMAANGAGSALFLGQELLWQEQRILTKFSFSPSPYATIRPAILGASFSESLLKDYNGQNYWLSFSPKQFSEKWPLPAWACFSLGYGIDEKLMGSVEYFVSNNQVFQAKRQLLLSFDLDIRELPIKRKWVKTILRPLHYIKLPFPTLIIDKKGLNGSLFYF